ncbi:MAG: hypothetical protein VB862_08545 [Pirellulaceae bacterium]
MIEGLLQLEDLSPDNSLSLLGPAGGVYCGATGNQGSAGAALCRVLYNVMLP